MVLLLLGHRAEEADYRDPNNGLWKFYILPPLDVSGDLWVLFLIPADKMRISTLGSDSIFSRMHLRCINEVPRKRSIWRL